MGFGAPPVDLSNLVTLDTAQSITGLKTFATLPQGGDPTLADELARKGYVDPLGVSMWAKDWVLQEISADPLAFYAFYQDAVRFGTRDETDEWRLFTQNLDIWGWRDELRLISRIYRGTQGTLTPEIWIIVGTTTDPKGNTTAAMFGIRHRNNLIYGYRADGTSGGQLSLGVAASQPTWVEARWVNGSRVEYYINGELKGVVTTLVPAVGASIVPYLAIQVTGAPGQTPSSPRDCWIIKPRIDIPMRKLALTDVNSSGQWSGPYRWGTAGEALSKYDICYRDVTGGNLKKAQANAAATMPGLFMALEDIALDAEGKFLCLGFITNSGWAWTVGSELYVSDTVAGGMTHTAPADSGEQVQRIGIAETATTIYFKPDLTVVEVA